jgi:molybdopterin synthase catalytic subunit
MRGSILQSPTGTSSPFCRPWLEGESVPSHLIRRPLELEPLIRAVSDPSHGGIATFLGVVRDHQDGRGVLRLEYSAYEPMAESEVQRIIAEVQARWPVKLALVHRLGELAIGDAAVAVAVGSAHRAQAFEACRYAVEEMKLRVPIWKKEFYADGTVAWVDPSAARPLDGAAARGSAEISR